MFPIRIDRLFEAALGQHFARAIGRKPDGLRDVAGVLDAAVEKLTSGGWFVMEFGYGQEDDVRRLVDARPALRLDRIRDDLQGIARTAIIRKS